MDVKLFATVFGTVFLAELGDKTQLATILYAGQPGNALSTVFLAAAAALLLSTGLGVAAGAWLAATFEPRVLTRIAGIGFLALGLWTLAKG